MVFQNIFSAASRGSGLFSVTPDGDRPQPGAGVDFEDSDDDTYDDTTPSLFANGIHGSTSRSKVVREESPEARAILGFLGAFIDSAQTSAADQARFAQPGSVSAAATAGMQESSAAVKDNGDLQKDDDLSSMPRKSDFTKPPKAPEAAKPDTPQAEKPAGDKK